MARDTKQSSVEEALRAHRTSLRRFVAARAAAADVDDVLQVAAMRAFERANSLNDQDRVMPWLYQIHRTAALDIGRKLAREQRTLDSLAAEPQAEAASDPETAICACSLEQARQLNSRYAAILNLVDIGGASTKEAARSLGVTVNTATVRLHRARKALKERLMAHCGVETMRECNDCRCTADRCCPT